MVIVTVKATSAFISKKVAIAQDRLPPPQLDMCGSLNPTVVSVPVKRVSHLGLFAAPLQPCRHVQHTCH